MWWALDVSGPALQMLVMHAYMQLGVEVVGMSLVLLTASLFPVCVLLCRTSAGCLTLVLLEVLLICALTVLDMLGFYVLFEATLMLLFLQIGRYAYGSLEAAYKIVMYTVAGSWVWLAMWQSALSWTSWLGAGALPSHAGWGLLLVFAVKMPLMPVHLWLPEAHVSAPTAGSVLLAGVLLKIGGLGFLRWMFPSVPAFSRAVLPLLAGAALVTFVWCACSTARQVDLKLIVAYSSIAHLSVVMLTLLCQGELCAVSASAMMVAHGVVSPALFLLVALLYERVHSKFLIYTRHLGATMPILSILLLVMLLANLSFPLFANFLAEVLCVLCLFAVHESFAAILCGCQVLAALYAFWAFQRLAHGYHTHSASSDLSRIELFSVLPLLIGVLWLGGPLQAGL